ncbi:MAG: hypothetical protein KTR25_18335 [Myxococcales bacterium]|nr:hypothetical protein [Myxococcales bacterium]
MAQLSISQTANAKPIKSKHEVTEPTTYRTHKYRSPVPNTLTGATVIHSPSELRELLNTQPDTLLLDVYPAPPRPPELRPGELWLEPTRESIRGAIWMANAGFGALNSTIEGLLKKTLEAKVKQNTQPIVVFCEPNCWHSWNAAKRIRSYGYTSVYWYRSGVEKWREAQLPLRMIRPMRP